MKRLAAVVAMFALLSAAILYFVRAQGPPSRGNGAGGALAENGEPTLLPEQAPVIVSAARRRPMRRTLTISGALKARSQAVVTAIAPARITRVLVRPGDRVRAGQPVLQVDARNALSQAAGASAALEAARAQYRRAVAGRRARAVEVEGQVAQAKGGLDTALAKLHQAELGATLTAANAESDAQRAAAAVRQAEAGLRQAETGLAQADDTVRRMRFLFSRGGIPRVDLEGAETQAAISRSQRDSALAALEQARAAAKPAESTAPLRKQVSQTDVEAARTGVRQAEEGLRNARRARNSALAVADQDVAAARSHVAQARAGNAQAASLAVSTLTSPIDGLVSEVSIHSGELAQPGQPLVSVSGASDLVFEGPAPARAASALRPGLPAHVTLDAYPGRTVEGTLSRILPIAPEMRSAPVEISLFRTNMKLEPFMPGRVVLDLARSAGAISIPVDALRNEGETSFVYVVVNGRAERRYPALGVTEGPYVQVLEGVSPGELVVVTGPASLQSGTPVQVVGRQ